MVKTFKQKLLCGGLLCCCFAGIAVAADVPKDEVNRPSILSPVDEIMTSMSTVFSATTGAPITLRYPSAVSSRNNEAYFVDAHLRQVLRYDYMQRTMKPFAGLSADEFTHVYVGYDLSVYITNAMSKQVLHFTRDGHALSSFSSPGNLVRPTAMAEEPDGARLFVADSVYDQIVVFNRLGMMLHVIKSDHIQGVGAMSAGPDGLYVVDRLTKKVVVLDWTGQFLYTLGEGELKMPSAIAVSRDNLVFVADNFDRTIKVYEDGVQISKIAGTSDITALAVDQNMLYVAEGQGARMRMMRINNGL